MLKKMDLHVVDFENGQDALNYLTTYFHDNRCSKCIPLVLSDNQMPIMGGEELSHKLYELKIKKRSNKLKKKSGQQKQENCQSIDANNLNDLNNLNY